MLVELGEEMVCDRNETQRLECARARHAADADGVLMRGSSTPSVTLDEPSSSVDTGTPQEPGPAPALPFGGGVKHVGIRLPRRHGRKRCRE